MTLFFVLHESPHPRRFKHQRHPDVLMAWFFHFQNCLSYCIWFSIFDNSELIFTRLSESGTPLHQLHGLRIMLKVLFSHNFILFSSENIKNKIFACYHESSEEKLNYSSRLPWKSLGVSFPRLVWMARRRIRAFVASSGIYFTACLQMFPPRSPSFQLVLIVW